MHLSDSTLDILLKDKTLNHRLLCELVEHPGFRQLMMDLEIYVNGLVSDRIRDANAMLEAMRQLIREKYDVETDAEMRTLQVGQLVEDEYFGRTIYEELSVILKDIRTAHITDDTTSDGSAIERVRQSIESAKSFEGSAEEQQLRTLCKQVGKDFDSLNKADVAATMRILRELTLTTTQQGRAVRKSMDTNNCAGKRAGNGKEESCQIDTIPPGKGKRCCGRKENVHHWFLCKPALGGRDR